MMSNITTSANVDNVSELTAPRRRRRRTDATRSVDAILRAAKETLATQPNASVEDIAAVAGVSRQTVYAHFRTRESLIGAVIDAVADEAAGAMDAARLDEGSAAEALLRLLDVSWRTTQRYPLLLTLAVAPREGDEEAEQERHRAVVDHLGQVLARGQAGGEFTNDQPTAWLASAVIALGHTAGAAVSAGRLTIEDAAGTLARSVLWLCGATPAVITKLLGSGRAAARGAADTASSGSRAPRRGRPG
jgi:AcrR family transcriptional regulator